MNENLIIILVILIIIFFNKYNSKISNNDFPKGNYKHIGNDLNGNLIVSVHDKKEENEESSKKKSSKKKSSKKKSEPTSSTSDINKHMYKYFVKDY